MSHINFVIPQSARELLSSTEDRYFVNDVIGVKELVVSLKMTHQRLRDEGPEFILENFDVYYSVLHHADNLQMNVIYTAYEQLHKSAQNLNGSLMYLLENQDSLNDELKVKYINVFKMLLYAYVNIVNLIEQKNETSKEQMLNYKGKIRKKQDANDDYYCDRKNVLLTFNYILQQDIKTFWDPPVVDEVFVNMVSEVCYRLLELPKIKDDKDVLTEIWSLLGLLVTNYNHGVTFIIRLVQLIKMRDHLVACVPAGIQQLINAYSCKSLVRDLVREITDWQIEEQHVDSQGSKNCSNILSEMAALMPNLMIPEIHYLTDYLACEPHTLRISVLNVLVEVIVKVLAKEGISNEELDSREQLFLHLEEHIKDSNSFVRTKVFQMFVKLQKESAIPKYTQLKVLQQSVVHLKDKAANVRKAAANCVTNFLEHNIFSATLQLSQLREDLKWTQSELKYLNADLRGIDIETLKRLETEWEKREEKITVALKYYLDERSGEVPETEIDENRLPSDMRTFIVNEQFEEAFKLCQQAIMTIELYKEIRDKIGPEQMEDIFKVTMRTIFLDIQPEAERANHNPSEKQLDDLNKLEHKVTYLANAVSFTELIDSARKPMKELLDSAAVGDMQEAVAFFVAGYKFNIDNSLMDILGMLRVMQRNDTDRKEIVLRALKDIYLTTDSKTSAEHTLTIVNRLIKLLQIVPFENLPDLDLIIVDWSASGVLDNSIIDTLWQFFTKKIDVGDLESRAALTLLTMAAKGRRSIISKNIKLVSTIAFGEPRSSDVLLVTEACRILSIAGSEPQNITDEKPPFRIKATDALWTSLCSIVLTNFTNKVKFFNQLIKASVELIYRLCATPIKVCETLVKSIVKKASAEVSPGECPRYIIIRFNTLLGEVAIRHLDYLDSNVYKELKRRSHIREEMKNPKVGTNPKKTKRNVSTASALNNSSIPQTEDSVLEGAQAEDKESETILRILETETVTENSALGNLAYMIVNVCTQPDTYQDEQVQCSAVTSLMRYMLVSDTFCARYTNLVFSILENTSYEDVKINILILISDLLERYPNIIDPYTHKLYEILHDPNMIVRKTTLYMLSNLILRDMVRPQGFIAELALCITDSNEELCDMAKYFFVQLAHKATNLYNALPDIFSHLCEKASDQNLQIIMKFLFGLIDKSKQMENLVDRFCTKFKLTEVEAIHVNIAFCLSLINYNEKGFRKLIDNFPSFKHLVLNTTIFTIFKQIITNCQKDPSQRQIMKELTRQLEDKIKEVFEITEGATMPKIPKKATTKSKSTKTKPRSKKVAARRSDSSESEDRSDQERTPKQNSSRRKSKRFEQSRI